MKLSLKSSFTFLILCLFITSCQQAPKEKTHLKVTVQPDTVDYVELKRQTDGLLIWDKVIDTLMKSENEFKTSFDVSKGEYAVLKAGKTFLKLILLPNQSYQLRITDSAVVYSGQNARGQEAYNSLLRIEPYSFELINSYANDSTPELLERKYEVLKQQEQAEINILYQQKAIDAKFKALMQVESDYYHAAAFYSIAQVRSDNAEGPLQQEWLAFMSGLLKAYPVETDYMPTYWAEHNVNALGCTPVYTNRTREERNALYEKDSLFYLIANALKDQTVEPYTERLMAHFLISETRRTQYQKSLINLYDDFTATYPQSIFSEYLRSDIDSFRDYHEKIDTDLPETITILKSDVAQSLKALLPQFEGQKLYIDM